VSPAQQGVRGIVWKRSDFRESSRLITLVTPEHGKLVTLGKGAHRPGSQCLGRIDFLNLLEVKISGGRLPILHRVRLVREHRALREPIRYSAASYLTEIFDPTFLSGRADPGLFELLAGGLLLLERCPAVAIPRVLAGIELKYLAELGLQPPLLQCRQCGQALSDGPLYPGEPHGGLCCRRHAGGDARAVPSRALRWLDDLRESPGRTWPGLPPVPRDARQLLGRWIANAMERRPRWRETAYRE
jgi:DNA repair protein RecO (recombination protein O)